METLLAVPSTILCISILVLSATLESPRPTSANPLCAILGLGSGIGLNFSTAVPFLTLGWHALSLFPRCRRQQQHHQQHQQHDPDAFPLRPLASQGPHTASEEARRIWAPRVLACLWFLNILLTLLTPTWSKDTAFVYAGLAALSGLEVGVLALGGVLVQYQILLLEDNVDYESGLEEETDADDERKSTEV